MSENRLLLIDGIINLALGGLLVLFPRSVIGFLGLPTVESAFYPGMLGAVLSGIGLALLIERSKDYWKVGGLGLGGAISINVCGGMVLTAWLLFAELQVPIHGKMIMWGLVGVLFFISLVELMVLRRTSR